MEDMFKELKKFRKEMDKAFKNFLEIPSAQSLMVSRSEFNSPSLANVVKMDLSRTDIKSNLMSDRVEVKDTIELNGLDEGLGIKMSELGLDHNSIKKLVK